MDKPEIKTIIVNESDGKSILSDIFTFGCLVAAFWANHEYLGDGVVLQIVLGISFFIATLAKASRSIRYMTHEEARKYFCGDTPREDER